MFVIFQLLKQVYKMEQSEEKMTYAHKADVISTRVGCLGGSDAKMLAQIDNLGSIPTSAYKRLAVCKGLISHESVTNRAMEYGDFVEQKVFELISKGDEEHYSSNPCWVSEKYSRKNVKCIDHVDVTCIDYESQTIYIWEVKASKYPTNTVRQEYKAQLYHHTLFGREKCSELGRKWRCKVFLAHYNTDGIDLEQDFTFDESRLTIQEVKFSGKLFDMEHSMDLVDEFLETFDFYTENEIISAQYLPEKIHAQFASIADAMREIKEREERVNDFKKKLYEFMVQKGIKSVSGDDYTFSVVMPSQTTSFDAKAYLADMDEKHPRVAKKLREQFKKTTNKSGYLAIKVKTKDSNTNA